MTNDITLGTDFSDAQEDAKTKTKTEPKTDKKPTAPIGINSIPSHMLQSRQIFLNEGVSKDSAQSVILQLRALAAQSKEPITLWINSPGGSVFDGLAVFDTMRDLMKDGIVIKTTACGMAASMASFLLSAGTPGYRTMLPSSRDMTHQPSRGFGGSLKEDDMQNNAKNMMQIRRRMESHYADFLGIDYKEEKARDLLKNYMGPDVYLNAYSAKRLGLIDHIALQEPSNDNSDVHAMKPATGITAEFLKRSIETDIYLNELEYNEIDSSNGSIDPARFIKLLIEYRDEVIAQKAKNATADMDVAPSAAPV